MWTENKALLKSFKQTASAQGSERYKSWWKRYGSCPGFSDSLSFPIKPGIETRCGNVGHQSFVGGVIVLDQIWPD